MSIQLTTIKEEVATLLEKSPITKEDRNEIEERLQRVKENYDSACSKKGEKIQTLHRNFQSYLAKNFPDLAKEGEENNMILQPLLLPYNQSERASEKIIKCTIEQVKQEIKKLSICRIS